MQEAITKTLLRGQFELGDVSVPSFPSDNYELHKGRIHIGSLRKYADILLSVMLLYFICSWKKIDKEIKWLKSQNLLKQIY